MDKKASLNAMREEVGRSLSTDPAKAANQLNDSIALYVVILQMAGRGPDFVSSQVVEMMTDYLQMFKAKVEEELLQSQKATNEALSAALGMRGQK